MKNAKAALACAVLFCSVAGLVGCSDNDDYRHDHRDRRSQADWNQDGYADRTDVNGSVTDQKANTAEGANRNIVAGNSYGSLANGTARGTEGSTGYRSGDYATNSQNTWTNGSTANAEQSNFGQYNGGQGGTVGSRPNGQGFLSDEVGVSPSSGYAKGSNPSDVPMTRGQSMPAPQVTPSGTAYTGPDAVTASAREEPTRTGPSDAQRAQWEARKGKGEWTNKQWDMDKPVSEWTVGADEVLPVIMAIDANEIAAGGLALQKDSGPMIKIYAKMLVDDHGNNLRDAIKLNDQTKGSENKTPSAPPTAMGDNTDSAQIAGYREGEWKACKAVAKKGAECLGKLTPLEGQDFRMAYLDAMIKGHTEALNIIDTKLTSAAVAEDTKKFVADTRDKVASHLKRAQEIKDQMK